MLFLFTKTTQYVALVEGFIIFLEISRMTHLTNDL